MQLIGILNRSQGSRIQRIQTTYNRSGSAATTVANAEPLADGRDTSDVIGCLGGHPTHMPVTLVSGGGTASGFNFAGTDGAAWTERGPRGEADHLGVRPTSATAPTGRLSAIVAPNPITSDRLRFRVVAEPGMRVWAEVYDVVGRAVGEVAVATGPTCRTPATVGLDGLAPGLYALRLTAGDEVATQTFVVVR